MMFGNDKPRKKGWIRIVGERYRNDKNFFTLMRNPSRNVPLPNKTYGTRKPNVANKQMPKQGFVPPKRNKKSYAFKLDPYPNVHHKNNNGYKPISKPNNGKMKSIVYVNVVIVIIVSNNNNKKQNKVLLRLPWRIVVVPVVLFPLPIQLLVSNHHLLVVVVRRVMVPSRLLPLDHLHYNPT
jgi:hypothetical protein